MQVNCPCAYAPQLCTHSNCSVCHSFNVKARLQKQSYKKINKLTIHHTQLTTIHQPHWLPRVALTAVTTESRVVLFLIQACHFSTQAIVFTSPIWLILMHSLGLAAMLVLKEMMPIIGNSHSLCMSPLVLLHGFMCSPGPWHHHLSAHRVLPLPIVMDVFPR